MKRTGFKTRTVQIKPTGRQWTGDAAPSQSPRVELRVSDGKARAVISLPKKPPFRSEAYRRRVAALPCAHCQRPGPSQCAHADEGKGLSLKASDHDTYPLCADGPGRRGCHALIGASGAFTREQRRVLERKYVAQTRAELEQGPEA